MTKKKTEGKQNGLFELTKQYQPFGVVGDEELPFMVDFRRKDGRSLACSYNYFLDAVYSSTQIVFQFYDTKVIVKGRNLKLVVEALTQYRLDYVQEWEPGMGAVPESRPCIDSIEEVLSPEMANLLAKAEKKAWEAGNG